MTKQYWLVHEFDDEPTFIVKDDDPDAPFIDFAPGNLEIAKRVLSFLNGSLANE